MTTFFHDENKTETKETIFENENYGESYGLNSSTVHWEKLEQHEGQYAFIYEKERQSSAMDVDVMLCYLS